MATAIDNGAAVRLLFNLGIVGAGVAGELAHDLFKQIF